MRVDPGYLPANPASRILSLGLLTVLLGSSGWIGISIAVLPLLILAWQYPQHAIHAGSMLRRLRWLLLSIAILYLWFTPGAALIPQLGSLSPSRPGLMLGALRILSLLVIVSYCVFLLRLTPVSQLIVGLQSLLKPAGRFGFETSRLAVRLGLVLDYVPRIEQFSRAELAQSDTSGHSGRLDAAARLFVAADNPPGRLSDADKPGDQVLDLPEPKSLRPLDVAVPLLLASLLILG
jgi:energy-coupling factor transport system permease protein